MAHRDIEHFNGEAKAALRKLEKGASDQAALRRSLGTLRRAVGNDDTLLAAHLRKRGDLANFGLSFSAETGRLAVAAAGGDKKVAAPRPPSLAERARAAAGRILKRRLTIDFDPALAHLTKSQDGASPQEKAAVGRMHKAAEANDWRQAAQMAAATPAIRQATLHHRVYGGNFDVFQPPAHDTRVVAAASLLAGVGWEWHEPGAEATHSWLAIQADGETVPLVRQTTLLASLHNAVAFGRRQAGRHTIDRFERRTELAHENWFTADAELLDLFGVELDTAMPDGFEMKPDDAAQLQEFIASRDELLAPSIGLLVVAQDYTRINTA